MTLKEFEDQNPAKYEEFRKGNAMRWKDGLELFSTVDELLEGI